MNILHPVSSGIKLLKVYMRSQFGALACNIVIRHPELAPTIGGTIYT
jgi:hypothetical protein